MDCTSMFYCLLLSLLYGINVNSMALKGPALTRYDPCGLGVIHFDRIKDQYWRGVMHFGLYASLLEVETEVQFENPVVIYTLPINTTFEVKRTANDNLLVKHAAPIPNQYIFHLEVLGNTSDIPNVSKFFLNKVVLCDSNIKAAQTIPSLNVSQYFSGQRYAHVCGRRSMNHTELVSVRTEAKAGDWPWHIAMLIKDPITNEAKYDCGGNIISRTAVLTAAHCIVKKGSVLEAYRVIVVAGTNNYKDVYQPGRQMLVAQELIKHPAYHEAYATSDLGIIKVNRFYYSEYVQPVCIWGPSYDKTNMFGKEATIVGFGSTEANKQADILRSSYTMIQNDTACIDFNPHVYKNLMNEFTFCAGYGPNTAINPRHGDSGGGLVVSTMQPDHMISWLLRGVLSKCGVAPNSTVCDPTYYVVYTDVGPHYGWIHHHSGLQFRINVP